MSQMIKGDNKVYEIISTEERGNERNALERRRNNTTNSALPFFRHLKVETVLKTKCRARNLCALHAIPIGELVVTWWKAGLWLAKWRPNLFVRKSNNIWAIKTATVFLDAVRLSKQSKVICGDTYVVFLLFPVKCSSKWELLKSVELEKRNVPVSNTISGAIEISRVCSRVMTALFMYKPC